MCGICGIVGAIPDSSLISRMSVVLIHRGPDQCGHYFSDGIALGHRRLSIIDLSPRGRQPMTNEDGSVWVVYNGEIYNFLELKQTLEAKGHSFKSNTDTEVIVHAYEEFGDDCVCHFRGMFAFGLWDVRRRRLLLARDYLGIKPLYYEYQPAQQRLLFASEIKAILQDDSVSRTLNLQAVNDFLAFQYVLGNDTILSSIHRVPPAHTVVFEGGSEPQMRCFWQLQHHIPSSGLSDEHVRQLRDLLDESVRLQLVSDVPIGVLLSGGLDSSAIVASMAQQGHRPVVTFTMGFKEADDELSYARSVASLYHTDHHEFTFAPHDLAEILPRIVWHMDEPMSDSGALATYWVSQFVRNHVKVILVGEGADEVFAGYRWHRFGSPRLRLIPECFRLRLAVYLATFFATRSRRARLDAYTPHDPHDRIMTYWRNAVGSDFLDRYLDYEIRFQLPNHLLMKVDRMTMAHSVEARVPYLDHRLVEFAASLPPEEKLSGWTGKMILRRAVAHRLPRDIIRRPKHGFIVPLGQWLQTSLREFAREHLLDRGSFTRLVFSEAAIEELFRPALNPLVSTERESLLWRLLVLEIWLELFVKGKQDEI